MKQFIYHPVAEEELNDAIDFINAANPGYGDEFYKEVSEAIRVIRIIGQQRTRFDPTTVRKIINRRFHCSIHYMESETLITIVAIAHHSRRPDYWRKRLKRNTP